ncbi:MAG: hypothetical protein HYZ40_04825 [Rhodospirillales bacterium]|nr:hypothetical protein [Rhodospirillales bacterium]
MTARSIEGWPRWLAALLMGLLLILALLIASWLLRTCAPVEPSARVTTLEAEPQPPPPVPPDPTPALKASLDDAAADGRKLAAEVAALEADIRRRLAQCKPVEAPKPPPPPVAQAPPPPPLPADRWAQKDLGMLQGCWRLGRDTRGSLNLSGRSEMCDVKAGRICFGTNGGGERSSTAVCPSTGAITCAAPITARFGNDSTLGTTQPAAPCRPAVAQWTGPPNRLTCRRVSDTLALCRDGLNFEYEFRRE